MKDQFNRLINLAKNEGEQDLTDYFDGKIILNRTANDLIAQCHFMVATDQQARALELMPEAAEDNSGEFAYIEHRLNVFEFIFRHHYLFLLEMARATENNFAEAMVEASVQQDRGGIPRAVFMNVSLLNRYWVVFEEVGHIYAHSLTDELRELISAVSRLVYRFKEFFNTDLETFLITRYSLTHDEAAEIASILRFSGNKDILDNVEARVEEFEDRLERISDQS